MSDCAGTHGFGRFKRSWRRAEKRMQAGFLALTAVFCAVFSAAPLSRAAGFDTGSVVSSVISGSELQVAEGVTYKEAMFKTSDGKQVAGFMLDTNYGQEGSDLKIAVGMPYDGNEFGMQPVSQQMSYAAASGKNAVAGVNADFYNMSTGEPEGLVIRNGVEIHGWSSPNGEISNRGPWRTFFGILEDGTAIIGDKEDYEVNKEKLVEAVGGDYIMVENGEMTDFAEEPNDQKNDLPVGPYARTCVGIREDGSVFFITIDGKRPDTYSAGLSLVEMAQLMIENGAETAMNLDGGGSATMVIKDPETKEYTVKNSPSDGTSGPTGGTERSVANSLYIYNDDETGLPSITLDQDSDGYYLIRSAEDFEQMNYNLRANFRLANDIDGTGKAVEDVKMFGGILDGDGHSVNNLMFSDPETNGLIGTLTPGGEIRDLTITNAVVSSTASNVGILTGTCNGTIRNVNISGSVSGSSNVGGLAGQIGGSGVEIADCHVAADVSASGSYAGILVGKGNNSTGGGISTCSATGTVSGNVGVGGLVGYMLDSKDFWIRDCMVTDVTVYGNAEHVGGVAGMAKCGVERCLVNGVDVQQNAPNSSNKHSASLITGWHNFSSLHISDNVVLKGSVTANNSTNSHRIAEGSGTRENNYACEKVTVNGEQRNGGNSYYEGISRTREELGEKSFYETLGFNFTEAGAWEWDSEQGAPVVKDSTFEIPENKPALTVDQEGYYLIREAADFLEIRKDPEGKYRLANDLKVSAGRSIMFPHSRESLTVSPIR